MSFSERFQILEPAGDEGANTFVAREISSGKKVTVFLFAGEQARAQADLLDRLRAADRTRFPELIEIGDDRGTPYAVTRPIGSLSELENRLSTLGTTTPFSPEHQPGEFSRRGVWQVPAALQSAPGATAKASRESAAPDAHPKAQTPDTPGSFTQMFQAPAAPIGEPAPGAPKPPAPSHAEPAPGSFTQMFQAPAAPIGEPALNAPKAATPPVPPKPAQSGPGEFTRFFSAASASPPAPAPVPQKTGPKGEFEHIFGSESRESAPPASFTGIFDQPSSAPATKQGAIPPAPASPRAYTPPAGDFTRIFGNTAAEIPPPGPAAPPPAPSAPTLPTGSPGEYTRMFSSQPFPPAPQAEPAPIATPEAPAPAKQTSNMIPVLIGVILILLAAIAVIVITIGK